MICPSVLIISYEMFKYSCKILLQSDQNMPAMLYVDNIKVELCYTEITAVHGAKFVVWTTELLPTLATSWQQIATSARNGFIMCISLVPLDCKVF